MKTEVGVRGFFIFFVDFFIFFGNFVDFFIFFEFFYFLLGVRGFLFFLVTSVVLFNIQTCTHPSAVCNGTHDDQREQAYPDASHLGGWPQDTDGQTFRRHHNVVPGQARVHRQQLAWRSF